ncbi:hypothetical protein GCM10010218_63020 [Streptomyces mashuensis]|uniref:DUF3574 domain-containing protein n=1 Tax=Streptomyces mashuensis TaxID=33904 RepID=A0A919BAT6_9ACTN|nr:DUF3574 domain-containing protein [Streptomyces mashuensis]GHF73208.1 hypothetical protein GCM10010218_63020 [Streptomyces mashuensis]
MAPTSVSRTRLALVALTAALLGASGPAAYAALDDAGGGPSTAAPKAVGKPYVKTELLFGTAKPDGGAPVTDQEFHAFVDEFVTPRFPAGLTIENAQGQYRDTHGTIERERSYKLTLLYPKREATADSRKIEEIRATYDKRFGQESVARIDDNELVDF